MTIALTVGCNQWEHRALLTRGVDFKKKSRHTKPVFLGRSRIKMDVCTVLYVLLFLAHRTITCKGGAIRSGAMETDSGIREDRYVRKDFIRKISFWMYFMPTTFIITITISLNISINTFKIFSCPYSRRWIRPNEQTIIHWIQCKIRDDGDVIDRRVRKIKCIGGDIC